MKTIHFALVSILLFAASCTHETAEEKTTVNPPNQVSLSKEQLQHIGLDTAKLVPEEEDLALTGKISFDESKVGKVYPLVGGNVLSVPVALGDFVHKGQLLATIRSAEISDMQSQFAVAQNNLEVAKKNLDIASELFKTNVNSETQLFAAKNEYARAESEVNRLQQELNVYGVSPTASDAIYNIYAPIEGYIVEKNVNENMEIRPDNNTNLFTVSSLNTVWVLADVYESDLAKISKGEEVEVNTLAYEGKIFKGKIDEIGSLLDPETKTMKIRIVMDNTDGLLKPEMFAMVKVHIDHPQKLVIVPSAALLFENNRFYVMVQKSAAQFERREVIPGPDKDRKTYIKSGVEAGELVVTDGSLLVANNNL